MKANLLTLLLTALLQTVALALPPGYQILPNTTSPNGKLGLAFPKVTPEYNSPDADLLLVQISPYKVVEEIPRTFSTLTGNNASYLVTWTADSQYLLVIENCKWGADQVIRGEMTPGGACATTSLTGTIKHILTPMFAAAKAPPYNNLLPYIFDSETRVTWKGDRVIKDTGWQLLPNGNVKVDCTATNDPKGISPKRWAVRFVGTYTPEFDGFENPQITPVP